MDKKNLCPFSGKPCKECALYRGRHFYMTCSKNGNNIKSGKTKELNEGINKKWFEY